MILEARKTGTLNHRSFASLQGQTVGSTTSGLTASVRALALRAVKKLPPDGSLLPGK